MSDNASCGVRIILEVPNWRTTETLPKLLAPPKAARRDSPNTGSGEDEKLAQEGDTSLVLRQVIHIGTLGMVEGGVRIVVVGVAIVGAATLPTFSLAAARESARAEQ